MPMKTRFDGTDVIKKLNSFREELDEERLKGLKGQEIAEKFCSECCTEDQKFIIQGLIDAEKKPLTWPLFEQAIIELYLCSELGFGSMPVANQMLYRFTTRVEEFRHSNNGDLTSYTIEVSSYAKYMYTNEVLFPLDSLKLYLYGLKDEFWRLYLTRNLLGKKALNAFNRTPEFNHNEMWNEIIKSAKILDKGLVRTDQFYPAVKKALESPELGSLTRSLQVTKQKPHCSLKLFDLAYEATKDFKQRIYYVLNYCPSFVVHQHFLIKQRQPDTATEQDLQDIRLFIHQKYSQYHKESIDRIYATETSKSESHERFVNGNSSVESELVGALKLMKKFAAQRPLGPDSKRLCYALPKLAAIFEEHFQSVYGQQKARLRAALAIMYPLPQIVQDFVLQTLNYDLNELYRVVVPYISFFATTYQSSHNLEAVFERVLMMADRSPLLYCNFCGSTGHEPDDCLVLDDFRNLSVDVYSVDNEVHYPGANPSSLNHMKSQELRDYLASAYDITNLKITARYNEVR